MVGNREAGRSPTRSHCKRPALASDVVWGHRYCLVDEHGYPAGLSGNSTLPMWHSERLAVQREGDSRQIPGAGVRGKLGRAIGCTSRRRRTSLKLELLDFLRS